MPLVLEVDSLWWLAKLLNADSAMGRQTVFSRDWPSERPSGVLMMLSQAPPTEALVFWLRLLSTLLSME